MIEVLSSGGGTQSTCMGALIVLGELPKPDLFVIADTGRECRTTWEYLDQVTIPAMKSVGVEVHRIGPEWKRVPAHGRDYKTHNENTLLIPAFTNQSGEVGKLSGFCSKTWENRGSKPVFVANIRHHTEPVPKMDWFFSGRVAESTENDVWRGIPQRVNSIPLDK